MQIDSTILSAPINAALTGDNTLITAVAGKTIHVVDMFLVAAGTTSLTFKDGAAALTGAIPMVANGSLILRENLNSEWFATTNPANNFVMNSSGVTVQVSGIIHYFLL